MVPQAAADDLPAHKGVGDRAQADEQQGHAQQLAVAAVPDGDADGAHDDVAGRVEARHALDEPQRLGRGARKADRGDEFRGREQAPDSDDGGDGAEDHGCVGEQAGGARGCGHFV